MLGDKNNLKVPYSVEDLKICLCPDCPSYNQCMEEKGELLFCISGKSTCKVEKWGCPCVRCPVQLKYGNIGLFYCEKGVIKK